MTEYRLKRLGTAAALVAALGLAGPSCRQQTEMSSGAVHSRSYEQGAPAADMEFHAPSVPDYIFSLRHTTGRSYPKGMTKEDAGFFYKDHYVISSGGVPTELAISGVVAAMADSLKKHNMLLGGDVGIDVIRDSDLENSRYHIRPGYSDARSRVSRATDPTMKKILIGKTKSWNNERAKDSGERGEDISKFLSYNDPERAKVSGIVTVVGSGCDPCRAFVYFRQKPRK